MAKTIGDTLHLIAKHLIDSRGDSATLNKITQQLGALMSINESNQNALNEIASTLNTEFAEVLAELDRLEAQEGAQAMDFSGLRTAVQSVTDTVSNAVPDVDPVVVVPEDPA